MRFVILLLSLFSFFCQPAVAEEGKGLLSGLQKLGVSVSNSEPELLPPDQAFGLSIRVKDGDTLIADFKPAKDYYLYRDKIEFKLPDGADARITRVALPRGDLKSDPTFGQTEVYHQPFQAVISLNRNQSSADKLTLHATYQGCNEPVGVCYPPINKSFNLALPVITAMAGAASGSAEAASRPAAGAELFQPSSTTSRELPRSDSVDIARLFKGKSFWLIVLSFLGFGLLLAFTPCMFPMIPILSGIVVGHGERLTRTRAFGLSAAYVLGMAITYAAAGVVAGLSGTMLSSALQNAWVLGGFALVFVLLSLSMFGLYELQLPSFLQSKLSDEVNHFKGGHVTGVFAMGALSALIVGPCVAAPLAGALLYISQTRDVVLGGAALFSMAIGMGLPLIVVGTSAGALLPRAGSWMEAVNRVFGVVLLGMAIWLISPVIPAVLHMLLWAGLLIVSAIYLHALDSLPPGASGFRKLWKGVGVIALLIGVALLVGALSGGRDILQPLSGLRMASAGPGSVTSTITPLPFQRVKTVADLDERIRQAQGKYVMLDFYADWCVSCKEMERFTFSDPRVRGKLSDVVLLQADVTANDADDVALLKRFSLFGPPGILFFDRQGQEIPAVRVIGTLAADRFLGLLNAVLI